MVALCKALAVHFSSFVSMLPKGLVEGALSKTVFQGDAMLQLSAPPDEPALIIEQLE